MTRSSHQPEEAEAKAPVLLDLGCGTKKDRGWIGIDIYENPVTDVVMDLDNPELQLAYEDGQVSEIKAHHFLEHIHNLFPLMNECYRVLAFNGHMDIVVPTGYESSFGDPSHVRAFTATSFHYFTDKPPGNYHNPAIKGKWKILLNDWSAPYTEDTSNLIIHKQRELHVYLAPIKEPPVGWTAEMDENKDEY